MSNQILINVLIPVLGLAVPMLFAIVFMTATKEEKETL